MVRELQGAPCAQRAALLSGQQEGTDEPAPSKGPSASFTLLHPPSPSPFFHKGIFLGCHTVVVLYFFLLVFHIITSSGDHRLISQSY